MSSLDLCHGVPLASFKSASRLCALGKLLGAQLSLKKNDGKSHFNTAVIRQAHGSMAILSGRPNVKLLSWGRLLLECRPIAERTRRDSRSVLLLE